VLIDIRALPELTRLDAVDGVLHIGAGVRHRDLELSPLVAQLAPLLAKAASTVGDPQVRSRGTIGGSIAHADPAADLPAVLLALDATIVVRGLEGEREIPVLDFFVDFWETALTPHEIVTEIRVPSAEGRPWNFQKFRQRSQEWAIVGIAALGGDASSIALVNMGATPLRAAEVEAALAGGASPADAAELADAGTSPSFDLRADAEYRRHLSKVLMRRALLEMAG
jgi:carbon-monoxide dehydrogenase medium subunit